MSLSMSRAEREGFLAGPHVGVLSVVSPDGGGPLAAPVWYTYRPGGTVNLSTGRGTRKALAIAAAGRISRWLTKGDQRDATTQSETVKHGQAVASVISVAMKPGAMALALMPKGPSSMPRVRVNPWIPIFAAE